MTGTHPVDVVALHPRVLILGRTQREQVRVDRFAKDLARWLFGEPRESLAPLARVVTLVARRELRDPKRLCRGRPLLAVEAAARATESLWPLLRGPLEEDPPEEAPPPPPPMGAGMGGGDGGDEEGEGASDGGEAAGAGPSADGEGDDDVEAEAEAEAEPDGGEDDATESDGDPGIDPSDLLAALAEEDGLDDPELDSLADRLRQAFGGEAADDMDMAAAAGQTLSEAAEAALTGALESEQVSRHLEQFLPGVGWSVSPGQLHGALLDRLDRLTMLLENLDQLDELAEALGRIEEPEDEDGDDEGGSEELVGVRFAGEVALALPSELGLLASPDTEDLFFQRLLERRLISLELIGAGLEGAGEGTERGPVIACIDTSGSMEGSPEMAAKALVLAICRKVLPQGRTVHLILFGGPDDRVELRLRRGLGGLEKLIEFLGFSFRGGTDFDQPLLRALELLEERELERADILVVTDGLARAAPDTIAAVGEARTRRHVRVWSVVLGHGDAFGVKPFSDEVWMLDPHGAAKAAGLIHRFQR